MWSLINVSSNLHIQLMLNSLVYNFLASLSSFGGIPSTPGYLLSFIFLMFFISFQELQITALNVPIYCPQI